jgi:hypothetical protein
MIDESSMSGVSQISPCKKNRSKDTDGMIKRT